MNNLHLGPMICSVQEVCYIGNNQIQLSNNRIVPVENNTLGIGEISYAAYHIYDGYAVWRIINDIADFYIRNRRRIVLIEFGDSFTQPVEEYVCRHNNEMYNSAYSKYIDGYSVRIYGDNLYTKLSIYK